MPDQPADQGVTSSRVVRFGVFEVDLHTRELRKRGVKLHLQQQPFQVLEALVERPGELVSRDDLRRRLWPSDTWVDFDQGLNKAVNKLREALDDSAESPRYIETLAKRGYRFIAAVTSAAPPVPPLTSSPADPRPDTGLAMRNRDDIAKHRLAYGAGLLVVAAALAVAILSFAPAMFGPGPASRAMLVILPFTNLEGNPEQDYFSDGITDEVISHVGRLRPDRLGVIARTSSMQYKSSSKRVRDIARELAVQYVVEGTVRRSGPRIRISARLIRGADETPLWSDSYESNMVEILDVQSDVARRIAHALAIELLAATDPSRTAASRPGADAYDRYLKGRYYWNRRGPTDLAQAVTLLESVVSQEPDYAPALVALADALNVLPWYGLSPPRQAYPRSKEMARRALALDEQSSAAHTALAYSYHYYDWNWSDAEREYQRALALNPSDAQAHQWLGAHYAELGRTDDALAEMRRAEQVDPRSQIIQAAIGWINYLGRRFDAAIAQLQQVLANDPDFVPARLWLGQALEATGRPHDAIQHYLHVTRLAGDGPTGLGELARGYAAAGRAPEARAAVSRLIELARTRYVEADLIARVFVALNEPEPALDWLERGFETRAPKMVQLAVDPAFDSLRDQPRFQDLVQRLNLPRRISPGRSE